MGMGRGETETGARPQIVVGLIGLEIRAGDLQGTIETAIGVRAARPDLSFVQMRMAIDRSGPDHAMAHVDTAFRVGLGWLNTGDLAVFQKEVD